MPKIEVKKKKIEINIGAGKVYPALADLEVTPSGERQVFTHEKSYGYDKVTVEGIQDENLKSENIKDGVNILGVEGNFVGKKYAPRYLYEPISFREYTGTELEHETTMLDTSCFTTMDWTFANCKNLISLDLRGWNTSNVKSMYAMFLQNQKLSELYLDNFNTSNVKNMYKMFNMCMSLTRLDLSSFDTSNVTNMAEMFWVCSSLKYLDIRNFTFDKVTNTSGMFTSVPADCEIIVKSDTERDWILTNGGVAFTNIKTVAELGGE